MNTFLEEYVAALAALVRDPYLSPRYFTEGDFLRHLGVSDEEIKRAEERAAADEGDDSADV